MNLLTLQAYLWDDSEYNLKTEDKANLHGWCLDINSKKYLLRVLNPPIFCHVELPNHINGKSVHWNEEKINIVYQSLCALLKDDAPTSFKYKLSYKLYYYRKNPSYNILVLYFPSSKALSHANNLLSKPVYIYGFDANLDLTIHDGRQTDISIILKFLTVKKLDYCGWFSANCALVPQDEKISTLELEYYVKFIDITPILSEESITWKTHPTILSFDIETYTDHYNKMPDKYNPSHVPYMLSCVSQQEGFPETRKHCLIVLGDCKTIIRNEKCYRESCIVDGYKIPEYEVIKVSSDIELCDKFMDIVGEIDPEIIISYNGFNYDYPYLNARLARKNIPWKSSSSKILGIAPEFRVKSWGSSAYGARNDQILYIPGRLAIDVMVAIKREYTHEMRYDLDTIGKRFLGIGKVPTDHIQMFKNYDNLKKARDEYQNIIMGWYEGIEPVYYDLPKTTIEKLKANYDKEVEIITRDADYCIEDSSRPLDLFEKLNMWTTFTESANINSVGITEQQISGQGIRITSLLYRECYENNIVVNKRPPESKGYKGAFVYEPIPGIYNYVMKLDFNSLYPSIIIAFNICFTTLINPAEHDIIGKEYCNIFEGTENLEKTNDEDEDDCDDEIIDKDDTLSLISSNKKILSETSGYYNHRYIKKDEKVGILPKMLIYLLSKRKNVKQQMKQALLNKNMELYKFLNIRQNQLKITANSIYGILGARFGRGLIEAARCVTAKGRELIQFCNDWIERNYNVNIIYNDTDSTMFNRSDIDTGIKAIKLSHEIETKINDGSIQELPNPLYLESETPPYIQIQLGKKMYGSWNIDDRETIKCLITGEKISNPNYGEPLPIDENGAITYKGIVLARRDNCTWHRECYRELFYNIMKGVKIEDNIKCIVNTIKKLLYDEVPIEDLTIVRGYGHTYKSSSACMPIFSNHLSSIGKPISAGDRIPYVIVMSSNSSSDNLGPKMRLPETYEENIGTDKFEPLDKIYYIEHLLMNSVETLWNICYSKDIIMHKNYNDQIDSYNIMKSVAENNSDFMEEFLKLFNTTTNYVTILNHIKNKIKEFNEVITSFYNIIEEHEHQDDLTDAYNIIKSFTENNSELKTEIIKYVINDNPNYVLILNNIKTKIKKWEALLLKYTREFVSGRYVTDLRYTNKPIKNIVKMIKLGRFEDVLAFYGC